MTIQSLLSGLGAPATAVDSISAYLDLLLHHNRRTNLIGPMDRSSVVSELVLDSLLPATVAVPRSPLIDIGSGAGLPGLPLAIAFPGVEVHLVEPRQKRNIFLRIAIRSLGLENVTIHARRIEAVSGVQAETVAAKAFRPPSELLALYTQLLDPGGLGYCYTSVSRWDHSVLAAVLSTGFRELGRAPHPFIEGRFAVVVERLSLECT